MGLVTKEEDGNHSLQEELQQLDMELPLTVKDNVL